MQVENEIRTTVAGSAEVLPIRNLPMIASESNCTKSFGSQHISASHCVHSVRHSRFKTRAEDVVRAAVLQKVRISNAAVGNGLLQFSIHRSSRAMAIVVAGPAVQARDTV